MLLQMFTNVTDLILDFAFLSGAESGKSRIKNPFLDLSKGTHPYCMLRRRGEKNIYFLVGSFQDKEFQKMKKWHFIGSG